MTLFIDSLHGLAVSPERYKESYGLDLKCRLLRKVGKWGDMEDWNKEDVLSY